MQTAMLSVVGGFCLVPVPTFGADRASQVVKASQEPTVTTRAVQEAKSSLGKDTLDVAQVIVRVDDLRGQSAFLRAQGILTTALKAHPGNFQLSLCQANLWRSMGLYARAKNLYEELHKVQPTAIEPLIALCQVNLENLRIREALTYSREAVRIAPVSSAAHLALAAALIADNSLTAAKLELDFIEQKFPGSAEFYYLESQYFTLQDDRPRAISALQAAIKLKPNNSQWWMQLGALYEQEGQYVEALDALNRYLRLNPTSIEALGKVAAIYEYNFHDYDRAVEYYKSILVIDKNIVDASVGIERCQRKNKDLAAALKDALWRFLRQSKSLGDVPKAPPSSAKN
jgi:tetratricopeptide (TPR) repeat protein